MAELTIKTTPECGAALVNVLNAVQGMENARALLPLYDATIAALKEAEQAFAAERAAKPVEG